MARHKILKSNTRQPRRALHRRLQREDPHSPPSEPMTPQAAWKERLLLFAVFVGGIALAVLALAFKG